MFDEHRFLTEAEASELIGAQPASRSAPLQLRSNGQLLGVKRGGTFVYPEFQFDDQRGEVRTVIPEVIALARANDWSNESLILWFVTATGYFDDTRPIDHWDEPAQIIAGARSRFEAEY